MKDGRPILVNINNITLIIPYVPGNDRGYKLVDEKCHAVVFQSGDEAVYVRNTYEEIREMLPCVVTSKDAISQKMNYETLIRFILGDEGKEKEDK